VQITSRKAVKKVTRDWAFACGSYSTPLYFLNFSKSKVNGFVIRKLDNSLRIFDKHNEDFFGIQSSLHNNSFMCSILILDM